MSALGCPLSHETNSDFVTSGQFQRYGRVPDTRCDLIREEGRQILAPYPGFVALLQPVGSSFSQDQVKLMAAAMVPGGPGRDPSLSCDLAVCGSQPFSGVLLIGNARLSHVSRVPTLGTKAAGRRLASRT